MGIKKIIKYPNSILRQKSRTVEKFDARLLLLVRDMFKTMYATEDGAGLAAVQVGVLRRVIVIDMGEGAHVLVNPEIVCAEGSQEDTEGCLSIPGRSGIVKRPARVTVKALDEKGTEYFISGEGALAKCLCHEIDHLEGKLYIDKIVKK